MFRIQHRWPARAAVLLLLALMLPGALAQSVTGDQEQAPPAAAVGEQAGTEAEGEEAEGDEVAGALEGAPPAIFAVGVSAGFPSYQTIALNASLQAQFVGFQLKGSWTAAGPYLAGQLRAYPPVPIPVPLFIGVGGGVYGDNLSYHAAIGAHVPLGQNLRLDLEGGVANVPLLAERTWAPHLVAGVSYAIPVDLSAARGSRTERNSDEERAVNQPTASCPEPREPDSSLLREAVEDTVNSWLRSAQATYGSVYTDLSYSYSISGTSISGNNASVTVRYSGSVTEILTGQRHSASGTSSATFRWNGCGWGGTGVEY